MSAKALLPNQCTPLHFLYGKSDCCLCNQKDLTVERERTLYDLKHELYANLQAYKQNLLSSSELVERLEQLEKTIPAHYHRP